MLYLKKEKYPCLLNFNKKEIFIKKIKTYKNPKTINNLPNELLSKIFKNLNLKDKTNCEKVCKRWQSLVYLDVKDLMIFINKNEKTIIMDSCSFKPEAFITDENISKIIEKLGCFLKKLSIEGIDFSKHFNLIKNIENNCFNLKHFYLKKFKNLSENLIYSLIEKIGKNLISLEIDNVITEDSYDKILNNLDPNKIKKLDCSFESAKVLDLICTNFSSLETLNINFFEDIKLDSLKKLKLNSCSISNNQLSVENLNYFIKNSYLSSLKELKLNCIRIETNFFKILNNFRNLDSLSVNLTSEEDIEIISRNIPNLKKLSISLTYYPLVAEIKSLDNFKKLETLYIKCHYFDRIIFNFDIVPTLKNFSIISTDKTSLNYDQSIKLSRAFPNLIKLQLEINLIFNFNFYKLLNLMKKLKYLVFFCDENYNTISIKEVIKCYESHKIDFVIYDKANNRTPFCSHMFIKFD